MSVFNTLRDRSSNSCTDGKSLQVGFLVLVVTIIGLGALLGMDTTVSSNEAVTFTSLTTELRSPSDNAKKNKDTIPPKHGYWDDLPSDHQEAAKLIGYSKASWDSSNDGDMRHIDKDWGDLSQAQKEAAKTMGYDEVTWCTEYDEHIGKKRESYTTSSTP